MVDVAVLAGELVGVFSTPCSGLCSGLKVTLERPVGLTRILLSVFLHSAVMFLFNPKVTFLELEDVLFSWTAGLWGRMAELLLAFLKNRGFGKKWVSNFTKSSSVFSDFFRVLLLSRAGNCPVLDSVTPLCSTEFDISFIFFLFFKIAVF